MKQFIPWAIVALIAVHCSDAAIAETAVADSIGPSTGIDLPVFWWDQFRPPEGLRQNLQVIVPLADGGLLIVADEYPGLYAPSDEQLDPDKHRILLIRTDNAGLEIWRQRYPSNFDWTTGANAVLAANGDIFLCDGRSNLYRLRADGTIVWHAADPQGHHVYICETMAVAPDDALYLSDAQHLPGVTGHPTLTRIDPSDGRVVWTISYDLYGVATVGLRTSIRFLSPDRLLWSFTGAPDNRDAKLNGSGAHLIVSSDGRLQMGGLPRFWPRPDHRTQRDKWMSAHIACLANGDIVRFGFELIEGIGYQLRIDRWSRSGFAPASTFVNTDWYRGYNIQDKLGGAEIFFLGERDGELIFAIINDNYGSDEGSFVVLATDGGGRTRWLRQFPVNPAFLDWTFDAAVSIAGTQMFLIDYDGDDPRPVGMHEIIRRVEFDRPPVVAACYRPG